MEKRIINPWKWQDDRHYVQAVEVTQVQGTLYCAGQAAVLPDGSSSTADMKTQLLIAIENLESVIAEAGYEVKNIVRLNVYTTAHQEFFTCFDTFGEWIAKNQIKQVGTFVGSQGALRNLEGRVGSYRCKIIHSHGLSICEH